MGVYWKMNNMKKSSKWYKYKNKATGDIVEVDKILNFQSINYCVGMKEIVVVLKPVPLCLSQNLKRVTLNWNNGIST